MKKKLLLTLALVSMFVFAFAIISSAETPEMYIEFGARFPGSDEYITVYTQNAESVGNPQINFATYKFYSDVNFTQEVDMLTVTGLDFSVTKTHGCNGNPPTRMTKPLDPFVNCVEVKWFLAGFPSISYGGQFFKGWTKLKYFDFGNATAISDNTFEGCGFESITIPATITSLGGSAFKNCTSLKSVIFEGNIEKFNNGATFYGCKALTDVKIDNLTSIGSSMFESCTALTSVTIPNSVTSIGTNAFYNCTALASVNIPSGVTTIGSNAFRSSALTSITIPSSVTSVGKEAFRQCGSLIEVVFEGDNTQLGETMFMSCGKLASITLPKNIEKIPNSSFFGCGKVVITNISELTKLTTIGSNAFKDAETLVFTLPDTVTTIENAAFQSAVRKSGGSFTINPTSQLTTIGADAFRDCRTLSGIYIPSTVTSIGANAFQQTHILTSIENFENCQITELCADTFSYSGIKSIKLPKTLKTLGAAFYDTSSLALVYIPNSVTSIADTFNGSQPANAVYIYTGKDVRALAACTRLAGANVIPAIEYDEAKTYTGINLVLGYSHCVAYNDGVHEDREIDVLVSTYLEKIKIVNKCQICDDVEITGEIDELFTYQGYSVPLSGKAGIVIGFAVNTEAIDEYEKITENTLEYGVFVVLKSRIGDNCIFDENGTAATGVIAAKMQNRNFAAFELKVSGFLEEEQKDIQLAMGAYVAENDGTETKYSYIQHSSPKENEKYYFASYNEMVKEVQ